MPSLDEIRRWARGKRVDGLPNPLQRKGVDKPVLRHREGKRNQYKISSNGDDALFLFGKLFRGHLASDIAKTVRGRKYLRWIIQNDFEDDLKEVCRYRLELWKREKLNKKST